LAKHSGALSSSEVADVTVEQERERERKGKRKRNKSVYKRVCGNAMQKEETHFSLLFGPVVDG
jgi:hypothetical protein